MNTTFSIRVDEKIKKNFLEKSKAKGVDGSALIRQFMDQFSKNPDIVKFEIEESIFDEVIDEVFKNNKIQAKLEKIGNKMQEIASNNI